MSLITATRHFNFRQTAVSTLRNSRLKHIFLINFNTRPKLSYANAYSSDVCPQNTPEDIDGHKFKLINDSGG